VLSGFFSFTPPLNPLPQGEGKEVGGYKKFSLALVQEMAKDKFPRPLRERARVRGNQHT